MKNFYQNIILTISVILLHINFIYGQTFNSQSQNRSWSANNNINTVFFKTSGVDLSITPNLNMIQFVDSNGATYGYNGDNDIPTDWTYEILDGNADLPANTTVSGDKILVFLIKNCCFWKLPLSGILLLFLENP